MTKYACVLTNLFVIPIEAKTKEDAQKAVQNIPKEELKKFYAGSRIQIKRHRGGIHA